ncbi:MAG: dockerin type I repeat-containing protein [bacterium]
MKKIRAFIFSLLIASTLSAQEYIVIGWNDLGMHCSNQDFSNLVVLPPYNNIRAHAIRVGDSLNLPLIVTTDFNITYEIPGNTYSIGKTNFWDYEDLLFGVNLPPNIGLTGAGLTGDMEAFEDFFLIDGVPITPYTDADLVNEDPYQLGLLKLYNSTGQLLASTQPVIPVSNEINCVSSGCHSSEQNILNEHDDAGGFDPNNTPILCASCHSSNALGTPGQPGLPSLSEAIHKKHGDKTNDCYKCHPGPNTDCFRGVMATEHNMICQDCHGSVTNVGESISNGREPWLQEPSCGAVQCHGSMYAEEPGKLFRQSRGHGGLYCSTCHGSPHAILPSGNDRDNVQNISLQGYAGTLNNCAVCHGYTPSGAGPHGLSGVCCVGIRGDANLDGSILVNDLVILVNYIFKGGMMPSCFEEGDANGNGSILVDDLVLLVNYLFKGGMGPAVCP